MRAVTRTGHAGAVLGGFVSILLVAVSAGCQANGDDARTSSDPHDLDAELGECMNRTEFGSPDQDVERRRLEDSDFNEALERCAETIGLQLPPPGELNRKIDEDVLKSISCMEDAGWEMPEPVRGEDGTYSYDGLDANVADDQMNEFDSDWEECTGTTWLPPRDVTDQ